MLHEIFLCWQRSLFAIQKETIFGCGSLEEREEEHKNPTWMCDEPSQYATKRPRWSNPIFHPYTMNFKPREKIKTVKFRCTRVTQQLRNFIFFRVFCSRGRSASSVLEETIESSAFGTHSDYGLVLWRRPNHPCICPLKACDDPHAQWLVKYTCRFHQPVALEGA